MWHVRARRGSVEAAFQAGGRPRGSADADLELEHAVASPEWHLEAAAIAHDVLGEHESTSVAENRIDARRVPQLVDRD
eukprot:6666594-Prymnesium_polylepis.1